MSDPDSSSFWDRLYQTDQFHWDLGGPTPVFQRLAENGRFEPGRMLVPGAGKGHDARLFTRHGFDVTAVDFSDEAVHVMRELQDPAHPIDIVQTDFFTLSPQWDGRCDYILDYTSFCAILPQRRPEYADMVTRLLAPGGRYIILAFPIGRRPGGPPYVVQPDAIVLMFRQRGFSLEHRERPFDSVPARKGHEELLILAKR